MWQCLKTSTQIQNTLLLILIMIFRLFKYSVIVDVISLFTMTHTIYCIALVYFKQYWIIIEHCSYYETKKTEKPK